MRFTAERVDVAVQDAEFVRLLGYPAGHVLEGRALELGEQARHWYAEHGQPWIHAREAKAFSLTDAGFAIDGREFHGARLRRSLVDACATTVVVAAVGAGVEAEAEAHRLWLAERPDEYFFLEVYASAVVEHLVTMVGARLCAMADGDGRAVLPHYSPGYPEWDIREQEQLLRVLRDDDELPGDLEVLDSGMLRPKKSLLAVFGVTHEKERVRSLSDLNPCTSCALPGCQYRRVAYRRPRSRILAEI